MSQSKVVFYVHFPDKLLASHASLLRRVYRWPFDFLEEATTRRADLLIANSKFTATIFAKAFPSIKAIPTVLYPAVDIKDEASSSSSSKKRYVVSLNRFERKKRIDVAIEAVALLNKDLELVVAGGYDDRVLENVEHLEELRRLASLKKVNVVFETSVSDERRVELLSNALCLLYTPPFEHFGIVPLEAMALGCPVIAVNSGGPLETIVDGTTGFLVDPSPKAFANKLQCFLDEPSLRKNLSSKCRAHVKHDFSSDAFADRLHTILTDLLNNNKKMK